jgi:hypothetical protein
VAILMGVEGGHMMASDPFILPTYYNPGVRYMTLTHTEHMPWADNASHPAAHNLQHLKASWITLLRIGMKLYVAGHIVDRPAGSGGTLRKFPTW